MRLVLFCSEKVCQLRINFSAIINAQEFSGKEKSDILNIWDQKNQKGKLCTHFQLLRSDGWTIRTRRCLPPTPAMSKLKSKQSNVRNYVLLILQITQILDILMLGLNMSLKITLSCGLIFTLFTRILDTFMFSLNMSLEITTLNLRTSTGVALRRFAS